MEVRRIQRYDEMQTADESNEYDHPKKSHWVLHTAVWRIDPGHNSQQHKPLASNQDPVLAERSSANYRFFGTSFDLDLVLLFFESWFKYGNKTSSYVRLIYDHFWKRFQT